LLVLLPLPGLRPRRGVQVLQRRRPRGARTKVRHEEQGVLGVGVVAHEGKRREHGRGEQGEGGRQRGGLGAAVGEGDGGVGEALAPGV